MATRDRQLALERLLRRAGFDAGASQPSPRLDVLSADARRDVVEVYRRLGGIDDAPSLRPSGWDVVCEDGIVEFDEAQHFNRYRALTLEPSWAGGLPWAEAYREHCREREDDCLRAASGQGRWTRAVPERQFGAAGPRGELAGGGAPRWKQRAVYDAMRDRWCLDQGVPLARVSVHDVVAGRTVDEALRDERADAEIVALVRRRLTGSPR